MFKLLSLAFFLWNFSHRKYFFLLETSGIPSLQTLLSIKHVLRFIIIFEKFNFTAIFSSFSDIANWSKKDRFLHFNFPSKSKCLVYFSLLLRDLYFRMKFVSIFAGHHDVKKPSFCLQKNVIRLIVWTYFLTWIILYP